MGTTRQVEIAGQRLQVVDMGDGDRAQANVSGARYEKTVAVAAAGTISALIDCGEGGCLCGLVMGGSVNAAGTLYLLASNGTAPTSRLKDTADAALAYTWAAAGAPIALNMGATFPFRYFKVDCVVAQTNGATITAITRGV